MVGGNRGTAQGEGQDHPRAVDRPSHIRHKVIYVVRVKACIADQVIYIISYKLYV